MDTLQLASMSNPPEVVTVAVSGDASPVDVILEELGQLYLDETEPVDSVNRFAETGLLDLRELGQLVGLERDDDSAPGAGQLRILLKPTDRFIQLVAALRARHIERNISID